MGGASAGATGGSGPPGGRTRGALRTTAALAVAALAAILAYGALAPGSDQAPSSATDGRPAPDLDLPVLNGGRLGPLAERLAPLLADGRLTSGELRGVPAVIDFWASWCVSCRQMAPMLQRAWREEARPRGVLLIGIDVRDVPADAREFLRAFQIDYPNLRDELGKVAARYRVTGIPQTFFVGADGTVRDRVLGTMSPEELATSIRRLAGTPADRRRRGR